MIAAYGGRPLKRYLRARAQHFIVADEKALRSERGDKSYVSFHADGACAMRRANVIAEDID